MLHTTSTQTNEFDETVCGICKEHISVFAVINSCCHAFCFKCIFEWAERSTRCPICGITFNHILFDEAPEKNVGSCYVQSWNFNEEPLSPYKLLKSYLFRLIHHNYVRPNSYLTSFLVTLFNHVLDLTGWFARWTAIKNGAPFQERDCIEDVLCRDILVCKYISVCEHKAYYRTKDDDPSKIQLVESLLSSKRKFFPDLFNNERASCGVFNENIIVISDSDDSLDAEQESSLKPNTRMLKLRNRAIKAYQYD